MPRLHATPLAVSPESEQVAVAALHALDRARFAPAADLVATFGPDGLTMETIDVWTAAGVVHRGTTVTDPVAGRETPYVALTLHGARVLAGVSGRPAQGIRPRTFKRSAQTRAHEVLKGAIVLALLALEREKRVEVVGVQADDKRLAMSVAMNGRGGARPVGLQPDLLVVLRRPRGNVALLFEVDRGTVAVRRMAEKFAAYEAWRRAGGPDRDLGLRAVRIVTTVPHDRRLTALHGAALLAVQGKRSGFFAFALQSSFKAGAPLTLLEPVVRLTCEGEARHVPLVDAA